MLLTGESKLMSIEVNSYEELVQNANEKAEKYINCALLRECVTAEIVDWNGKVIACQHFD